MKAIFLYIFSTCLIVVWTPNAHAERRNQASHKSSGIHAEGQSDRQSDGQSGTRDEKSAGSTQSIFPIRVYFDTASTLPMASTYLAPVVAWMQTSHVPLIIEGHADPRGDTDDNLELGDRRARQVKADLVAGGADASRLLIVSQGEVSPLSSLAGEAGWQENRVVSILPLVSFNPE